MLGPARTINRQLHLLGAIRWGKKTDFSPNVVEVETTIREE